MRVAHSLPTAGLGLALLATFGFAGQSTQLPQQAKKPVTAQVPELRGTEQLILEPHTVSWSEMLEIQARQPSNSSQEIVVPPMGLDVPLFDIDEAGASSPVRGQAQPLGGGIEPMVACPSLGAEPALDHGFVAQPDVTDGLGTSFIPPNVAGDVGPLHLMTMMNNKTHIQDRLGGTISSVDTSVFWTGASGAALAFPKVHYDEVNGRWFATVRSGAGGAMLINVAISDTNDPTGTWDFYGILADAGGLTFPDWVMNGTNANWATMIANMFNVAGGALAGVKMWVVDMASLLAGGPVTVTVFATGFNAAITGGATGNSFNVTTSLDTSTSDMWLVNSTFGNTATPSNRTLQLIRISGTGPAPVASALAGSPFGGTTSLCFVTHNFSTTLIVAGQVGDARFITPFSIRIMSAVLRNGKIWVAHVGGQPLAPAAITRTAAFWHQVDPTLPFPASPGAPGSMLTQSNVIDGGLASSGIMYPSVSVNCGDDAVIGFSRADTTRHPEAGYVVHVGSDPAGSQSPIRLLKAGDSSYWKNFGVGAFAQWGLYSSTGVDPVDDKTFWTLQEYAAQRVGPADNDSRWGTWWGRIGECGEPLVTDDPDAVTVCVGDPASFSVSATPSIGAGLAYQWRKDGVDLPGETASSLSIAATVNGDAGTYDVRVIDGCGSVLSASALLDFAGAVVTSQPVNQNVPKFGTATFTVAATGSGTLTYSWRKDGVPLSPAETNPTLIISPVTRPDIGFYDCIVSDVCGPTTSNSAVLSIPFEGKNFGQDSLELAIFKQPESAIVCEGTNHNLTVIAHGENLSYLWRKGGVAIVPPETNATLVLSNIDPSHNGSYDVIVTDNSGFIVSDSVVIDVDDLATITQHPTNVGAQNGDDVSFSVTATGDGELFYQWQKGGLIGALNDMPGETGPTLELQNINNQDAGRYRCKVINHCGTVFSNTAKLTLVQ